MVISMYKNKPCINLFCSVYFVKCLYLYQLKGSAGRPFVHFLLIILLMCSVFSFKQRLYTDIKQRIRHKEGTFQTKTVRKYKTENKV